MRPARLGSRTVLLPWNLLAIRLPRRVFRPPSAAPLPRGPADSGVRSRRIGSSLRRPAGSYPAGCFHPLVGHSHTSTAGSALWSSRYFRGVTRRAIVNRLPLPDHQSAPSYCSNHFPRSSYLPPHCAMFKLVTYCLSTFARRRFRHRKAMPPAFPDDRLRTAGPRTGVRARPEEGRVAAPRLRR